MDQLLVGLGWLQLAAAAFSLVVALRGCTMLWQYFSSVRNLGDVTYDHAFRWPTVSLIAPARNEERNIEEAIRSLLAIEYPSLEITVVNDRSTDRTGEILRRLAAEEPRINLVEINELPAGWLGKNHALEVGARRSTGEWLLFTDADVIFAPRVVKQGIAFALRTGCDHLSAFPDMKLKSWLLMAAVITFVQNLVFFVRPWEVRNPKSRAYMGVGAFNLVRREAYWKAGGHEAIRLRPDDDLRLGQVLKLGGFQSDVINAPGVLTVEWYASLDEMIRGLEKNSAAPLEYNFAAILGACGILIVAFLWPFLAVWFATGVAWYLFAATCSILLFNNLITAWQLRKPLWLGWLYPITMAIFVYIQLRSLGLLWYHHGIHWRGTHYSLDELRTNRLP